MIDIQAALRGPEIARQDLADILQDVQAQEKQNLKMVSPWNACEIEQYLIQHIRLQVVMSLRFRFLFLIICFLRNELLLTLNCVKPRLLHFNFCGKLEGHQIVHRHTQVRKSSIICVLTATRKRVLWNLLNQMPNMMQPTRKPHRLYKKQEQQYTNIWRRFDMSLHLIVWLSVIFNNPYLSIL